MQNKDDKTKRTQREQLKLTVAVLALGLLIWIVFIGQAMASEPSKVDRCIQRAVDAIKQESGGVDMDEWFYVVSIREGKCVFVIGENEDYTGELLENQREQQRRIDYMQRNQRNF